MAAIWTNWGLALAGFFGAAVLCAAEVSGRWVAQIPDDHGNRRPVTLRLDRDGDALTGTLEDSGGEREISDGIMDGDYISFRVVWAAEGRLRSEHYKGYVEGSTIHFSLTRDPGGGSASSRQFEAYR